MKRTVIAEFPPRPVTVLRQSQRRVAAAVLTAALSACGAPSTPTAPVPIRPPVMRVFATNLEWIDTFTMDIGGSLSVGPRLTPTRGITTTVVAGRGTRLYLTNLNGIEGYSIDPDTGGITPLPGSPFTAERGSVTRDPLERFVWLRRSGGIQAFRINPSTGQLTPGGPPTSVSQFLSTLVVDASGSFVYGFAEQRLEGYRVEETGALTPLPGSPYSLPPEGVNPSDLRAGTGAAASLLFFGGQGDGIRGSHLVVHRFDPATGVPLWRLMMPVPADRVVDGLAVSPSGAFLYVALRNRLSTDERPGLVTVYAVDPAGQLGFDAVASVTTGRSFFSDMEIAPDGRFLFVTLKPSPFVLPLGPAALAVFRVDGGTMLTPVAGSPHGVGPGPHTIHAFETQPTSR